MALVYVTGHRNPDLDSIGSAIGYAELRGRTDPQTRYVAARLGPVNAQTAWALERSGAPLPELLEHIRLRVRDVMQESVFTARASDPVRSVGLAMAERGLDMVPIVDDDGALVGVITEGDLARMYIRESQQASDFSARPASIEAVRGVLGGEVLVGEDRHVSGRLWVISMDVDDMDAFVASGDIVVVGNRPDVLRRAVELDVGLLVTSNGTRPGDDLLDLARARDTTVIVSPLDSYVSARMIQLSVPCRTVMSSDPLTVVADDVLGDVTQQILEVDYRAAIAVDSGRVPVAVVSRSNLVNPEPRQVLLVDHAEQAQSVPGIEQANIVEILDHHHIGSIETKVPVKATFDPVGSTATLVVERFRRDGREPRRATAMMLLAAALSDTVILTSPTTTDRDRRVVAYLEELVELDSTAFGTEMFQATSDVSRLSADEIVRLDAKEYEADSGRVICVAQVETVGPGLIERKEELLDALRRICAERGYALYALMVTDIVRKGTELLVAGDPTPIERAMAVQEQDGLIDLPGVMSRKKQVAPKLLAAL
jgi:manganese-dependent inorganic pyrophosphatase